MDTELKNKLFGQIAVKLGYITTDDVSNALLKQETDEIIGQQKHIGTYFFEDGLLNKEQISKVLQLQKKYIEKIEQDQNRSSQDSSFTKRDAIQSIITSELNIPINEVPQSINIPNSIINTANNSNKPNEILDTSFKSSTNEQKEQIIRPSSNVLNTSNSVKLLKSILEINSDPYKTCYRCDKEMPLEQVRPLNADVVNYFSVRKKCFQKKCPSCGYETSEPLLETIIRKKEEWKPSNKDIIAVILLGFCVFVYTLFIYADYYNEYSPDAYETTNDNRYSRHTDSEEEVAQKRFLEHWNYCIHAMNLSVFVGSLGCFIGGLMIWRERILGCYIIKMVSFLVMMSYVMIGLFFSVAPIIDICFKSFSLWPLIQFYKTNWLHFGTILIEYVIWLFVFMTIIKYHASRWGRIPLSFLIKMSKKESTS